eukprot:Pgem_evm1s5045
MNPPARSKHLTNDHNYPCNFGIRNLAIYHPPSRNKQSNFEKREKKRVTKKRIGLVSPGNC